MGHRRRAAGGDGFAGAIEFERADMSDRRHQEQIRWMRADAQTDNLGLDDVQYLIGKNGTEGLNFRQFIGLLPWTPPLH